MRKVSFCCQPLQISSLSHPGSCNHTMHVKILATFPSNCSLLPRLFHLEHPNLLGYPSSSAHPEAALAHGHRVLGHHWAGAKGPGAAAARQHRCSKLGCPDKSAAAFLGLSIPYWHIQQQQPAPLNQCSDHPQVLPSSQKTEIYFLFQENKQKFFLMAGGPLWVSVWF